MNSDDTGDDAQPEGFPMSGPISDRIRPAWCDTYSRADSDLPAPTIDAWLAAVPLLVGPARRTVQIMADEVASN